MSVSSPQWSLDNDRDGHLALLEGISDGSQDPGACNQMGLGRVGWGGG